MLKIWKQMNSKMFIYLPFKKNEISLNSNVYVELFNVYGFSFYKYFLVMKKLGIFGFKPTKFLIFNEANKLSCFKVFFITNFVFSNKLKNYVRGRKNKYLSFFNYKRIRIACGLPVRGQRTQTNSKTFKKIKYV